MRTKKETKADELRKWLSDKRLILDCGHKWCNHNFSNTMIVYENGKMVCHS
jgi:hypothetical protein